MEQLTVIKSAIKADVPVLLEGHTGTGKTYAIMTLAKELKKTLHVINVSGELTVDSILGQQTLLEGSVLWRDGVLTTAMKNGDWVLFDEMNTALPEVMTVINGVLDDTRSVTLPNADNERVKAHEDFRFIGTQNPTGGQYAGTGRLNDALLNRMIKVQFGYMSPRDEINAVKSHAKMSDTSITALVNIAQYTRDNGFDNPISTRDLVKIVRLRDKGSMSIRDAVSAVLYQKYSADEYRRVYQRFSDKLRELDTLMSNRQEDPFDYLAKELAKIRDEKLELAKQKLDLRAEVRRELLQELLSGNASGVATPPVGF